MSSATSSSVLQPSSLATPPPPPAAPLPPVAAKVDWFFRIRCLAYVAAAALCGALGHVGLAVGTLALGALVEGILWRKSQVIVLEIGDAIQAQDFGKLRRIFWEWNADCGHLSLQKQQELLHNIFAATNGELLAHSLPEDVLGKLSAISPDFSTDKWLMDYFKREVCEGNVDLSKLQAFFDHPNFGDMYATIEDAVVEAAPHPERHSIVHRLLKECMKKKLPRLNQRRLANIPWNPWGENGPMLKTIQDYCHQNFAAFGVDPHA